MSSLTAKEKAPCGQEEITIDDPATSAHPDKRGKRENQEQSVATEELAKSEKSEKSGQCGEVDKVAKSGQCEKAETSVKYEEFGEKEDTTNSGESGIEALILVDICLPKSPPKKPENNKQ